MDPILSSTVMNYIFEHHISIATIVISLISLTGIILSSKANKISIGIASSYGFNRVVKKWGWTGRKTYIHKKYGRFRV